MLQTLGGIVLFVGIILVVGSWAWSIVQKYLPATAASPTGLVISKAVDYSEDISATIALKGVLLHPAIKADPILTNAINQAIAALWVNPVVVSQPATK